MPMAHAPAGNCFLLFFLFEIQEGDRIAAGGDQSNKIIGGQPDRRFIGIGVTTDGLMIKGTVNVYLDNVL